MRHSNKMAVQVHTHWKETSLQCLSVLRVQQSTEDYCWPNPTRKSLRPYRSMAACRSLGYQPISGSWIVPCRSDPSVTTRCAQSCIKEEQQPHERGEECITLYDVSFGESGLQRSTTESCGSYKVLTSQPIKPDVDILIRQSFRPTSRTIPDRVTFRSVSTVTDSAEMPSGSYAAKRTVKVEISCFRFKVTA